MPKFAGSAAAVVEELAEQDNVAVAIVVVSAGRTAAGWDWEMVDDVAVVAADVVAVEVAVAVAAEDVEDSAAVGVAVVSSSTSAASSSGTFWSEAPSTKRWTPSRRLFAAEAPETLWDQPPH